ncbi:MAG: cytidylyltransferase domain-containing protein [Planctomycetota bacterium]|jgi:spore coat polysaccharide biosynthesis protein SpsF
MRIGAIIQARMSSRRLPGKVLMPVAGRPLLEYLLDRVEMCGEIVGTVVATSVGEHDDPIAAFCREFAVPCTRGPLDNVAQRFASAAAFFQLDAFVRLCADSPLVDTELISRAVREFRAREVDLVTNVFPRTFPPGQSVEVVDARVFAAAVAAMDDPDDLEHVTRYFYDHADRYRIWNMPSDHLPRDVSFAVDTRADLERFEAVVAALERPHWSYGLAELIEIQRRLAVATAGADR